MEMLKARDRVLRRKFNGSLKNKMEKDECGFGLEDHIARWNLLIRIEMLMNTHVLHNADIPCLPGIFGPVVNIIAISLKDIENSAVHMTMFLAVA